MKEIKERTPLESARRSKISAISFISAGHRDQCAAISGASRSNQNKIQIICEICAICGPPKIISEIRGKRIISG